MFIWENLASISYWASKGIICCISKVELHGVAACFLLLPLGQVRGSEKRQGRNARLIQRGQDLQSIMSADLVPFNILFKYLCNSMLAECFLCCFLPALQPLHLSIGLTCTSEANKGPQLVFSLIGTCWI